MEGLIVAEAPDMVLLTGMPEMEALKVLEFEARTPNEWRRLFVIVVSCMCIIIVACRALGAPIRQVTR